MAVYDFACPNGHGDYEVRCAIAERTNPHPCPECGTPGKKVILAVPHLNDTSVAILSYPGSKALKAGYQHTHGDFSATKISSGYGGTFSPKT